MAKKQNKEKSDRDPLIEKLLSDEPLKSEPIIIIPPQNDREITKEFPVVEVVQPKVVIDIPEKPPVEKTPEIVIKKPAEETPFVVPVPLIVPSKPQPAPQPKKKVQKFHYSGFRTFEENYPKIQRFLDEGWKIISERKTTTEHYIVIER
jgi:hypothetical protein